jgi:drug/metabolite transporter (DMT)-like permease
MMPPLTYAFVAMAMIVVLGLLHKHADRRDCRPEQINLLLFAWSALFGLASLAGAGHHPGVPLQVWQVALPCGIFAATAVLLFQIGVRQGLIATSWLVINLSAAIPVAVSVAWYGENVSSRQALALLALIAALVLLWLDRRTASS